MQIIPIATRALKAPHDDLLAVIDELTLPIVERSVVVITAKVVAIHQGRCVPMPEDPEAAKRLRRELAKQESELYLELSEDYEFSRLFTIYEGTFCSLSGIDASNSGGYFSLLPKHSSQFAAALRQRLQDRYHVNELGVLITDSRSFPMRNGTIGVTVGYAGFKAEFDYRGTQDIFGRAFVSERINVADCLASAAILTMGEGNESTPLAVVHDIAHITFADTDDTDDLCLTLKVPMQQDVFAQFLQPHPWQPGGRHDESRT